MKPQASISSEKESELRFGGNWFIDAGILGFVNLMGEVYKWSPEYLVRKISEEENLVYYGYFPFAYVYDNYAKKGFELDDTILEQFCKEVGKFKGKDKQQIFDFSWDYIIQISKLPWIKIKIRKILDEGVNKEKKIDFEYTEDLNKKTVDLINKLSELRCEIEKNNELRKRFNLDKKRKKEVELDENILDQVLNDDTLTTYSKAFLGYEETLEKIFEDEKNKSEYDKFFRIPVNDSFLGNFLFLNPASVFSAQKNDFFAVVDTQEEYSQYLKKLDKTINKLLASEDEFHNEFYTTALKTSNISKTEKHLFTYFLCFKKAFTQITGRYNLFFYSPSLDFCFLVNSKIKTRIKILTEGADERRILSVTWHSIIDSVLEQKSTWVMENMYFIKYEKLDNQSQKGVEYVGISKLHAEIILDDKLREALNTSIRYRIKGGYAWLIEELIRNNTLYPLILNHLWLRITAKRKEDKYPASYFSLYYGLSIDSEIKKIINEKNFVFSEKSFCRYKSLVDESKKAGGHMSYASNAFYDLIRNNKNNNLIVLFTAIKDSNKSNFLNSICKLLVAYSDDPKSDIIRRYVYEKILTNDDCWENYAVAMLIKIIGEMND